MAEPRVMMHNREMGIQAAITAIEARLHYVTELHETMWARLVLQQREDRTLNLKLLDRIGVCDGSSPEAVELFFQRLEDAAELASWDAPQRLRLTRLLLEGPALVFFKAERTCKLAGTYVELKRLLTERFADRTTMVEYHLQLQSIRQNEAEDIECFADRAKLISGKAMPRDENPLVDAVLTEEMDRRALDAFLRGLGGKVGLQTRIDFPTTIKAAVDTAINVKKVFEQSVETAERSSEEVSETETRYRQVKRKRRRRPSVRGVSSEEVAKWSGEDPEAVVGAIRVEKRSNRDALPCDSGCKQANGIEVARGKVNRSTRRKMRNLGSLRETRVGVLRCETVRDKRSNRDAWPHESEPARDNDNASSMKDRSMKREPRSSEGLREMRIGILTSEPVREKRSPAVRLARGARFRRKPNVDFGRKLTWRSEGFKLPVQLKRLDRDNYSFEAIFGTHWKGRPK